MGSQGVHCVYCEGPPREIGYTIGSLRERRIVNVEVAPDDVAVTDIRGPYFHANHYPIGFSRAARSAGSVLP